MTTIKLTVSGAHVTAQPDGPLTSGMVGLPVVISYDSAWDGLTKTLVCRNSMGKAALDLVYVQANVGTQATVAPEVMVAHRHLYLGLEGRSADGTLVVPTIWADCGMIQPGAESNGMESQEATPEVWVQLASQIGPLDELDTANKGSLVTAINELSLEAEAAQNALAQQINEVQNLGNQNSTNLTAAKKELEAGIQNLHNQLSADIRALEEEMARIPQPEIAPEPSGDDIPRVFLEGNLPTGLEETQGAMTYISKTDRFSAYLNVRGVDDSSLNQEKRSFTIEMFSNAGRSSKLSKSFRDWGYASNTYVLRANFIDHSHGRNIVSSRLWGEIMASREDYQSLPAQLQDSPRNGASDGFPVKVYINGSYQGIYTWNMDAERWNMSGSSQGVLRALTNSSAEKPDTPCNFRSAWSGISGDHWALEAGSGTMTTSLNNLISFVQTSTDEQFRNSVGNYLDLSSAMDYYLFQYAICGVDGLGKNLRLATYNGSKWFCGVGDLDATFLLNPSGGSYTAANCACPKDYQESRSLLWERLVKNFAQEMKDRYQQLRSEVLSYPNMCSHFEAFMDIIGAEAYQEDAEIFPSIPLAGSNNIRQIREAIRDRLAYCDEAIETLGQESGSTGAIDYTRNPLADVTWTDGSYYVNGELTAKSSEHCTSRFTLQNCLYQLTYSGGLNPTLYIWDQDGNYLGYAESQLSYFTGNPNYQYVFRITQSSGFDPGNVSIMPVNNEETAMAPLNLKLADLSYSVDYNAIQTNVNDLFSLETVNVANIAATIHHANVMVTIGSSYTKPNSVDAERLAIVSFYPSSKKVYFGTRLYGNVVEDARAYFNEHNTTVQING